jgi:uncharacterized damage-inducible protein DinB
MPRPQVTDYAPFQEAYISKVQSNDVHAILEKEAPTVETFYLNLPESKADYRYAEGKWTLRDLLQHVIDTERILSYRLLRIARKDETPNPSFDEESFAANAGTASRSFDSLKEEFKAVRRSTDHLLKSLNEDQLSSIGISSNHRASANAIAFVIFGHLMHHKAIIEERYLSR